MEKLIGIIVIAYLVLCVGCCVNASGRESMMVDINAVSTFAQQPESRLLVNDESPIIGFDVLQSEPGEIVPSLIHLPSFMGDEDEDEDESSGDNKKQIINLR